MNSLLAIHTFPGGSPALLRHAPYFERSGASRIVAITTTDGVCMVPEGWEQKAIGVNSYMNGDVLCRRLLDTIAWCAKQPEDRYIIAEYDVLFFHPVPEFSGICVDKTGGQTWGSEASWFGHNPWCLDRESCQPLMNAMVEIIMQGHCTYGKPESSPDVFFAYACERSGLPVKHDLMRLFTRNCFDTPGSLYEARQAYLDGCDVIHGCKTKAELEFITR